MMRKAVFLVVASMLLAVPAQAQSLDDVLKNYYKAIGGMDAWTGLQSIKATGKMTMGPGMEAPFTMTAKRPSKVRIDFTVQGMTGTQAYDGETAWMVMPFMGRTDPEVMPEELAKNLKDEADIDGPIVGYKESGHQLELIGLDETAGTKAYKLKLTRKSGDVEFYFLDAEYYIPIKVEGKRTFQGNEIEFETILSDYKDVSGLMMAHSVESKPKGAPAGQVITIESVEVNTAVEDGSFTMPKPKKEGQQ